MIKRTYIMLVGMLLLLSSCSRDDDGSSVDMPICFTGDNSAMVSRSSDGADALYHYIKDFTVYGVNGNISGSTFNKNTGVVFPNYKVWYETTASSSNDSNWEYVDGSQVIKYWDDAKNAYYFWAVGDSKQGTFSGDNAAFLSNGLVNTYSTIVRDAQMAADSICFYYADPVCRQSSESTPASKQGSVGLTFHRISAKVRIGFYEDVKDNSEIHNYTVSSLKFHTVATDGTFVETSSQDSVYLRGSFADSIRASLAYDYTDLTAPKVTATPCQCDNPTTTKSKMIGKLHVSYDNFPSQSDSAVWVVADTASNIKPKPADADNAYFNVLPVVSGKASDISIMCDYQVMDKREPANIQTFNMVVATVPKEYSQWEPGHAYTYIFKITQKGTIILADVKVAIWNWEEGRDITTEWHNW